MELTELEETSNINYKWSRFRLTENELESTIDVYLPRPQNTAMPWVILHPILKGDNVVARLMANYFATFHRWNIAILHRGEYPYEANTPDGFNFRLKDVFKQHQGLADWIKSYFTIHHHRIISIGTSMGGIAHSGSAAHLPYAGYISIVAGSDILDIVSTSNKDEFKKWREKQREQYGENYYDEYKDSLTHDISNLVERGDADKNMLNVIALFDRIVPTKTQKRLKRLYNAQAIYIPAGHKTTIMFFPILLPIMSVWSWWQLRKSK